MHEKRGGGALFFVRLYHNDKEKSLKIKIQSKREKTA